MNYETWITVIRNSGLKFISMILLNFQIFTLLRKFRFHQYTSPLKIFHLELYFIVQYHFHSCFQQVAQVCLQVAQVFMSQKLWTKPLLPSWMAITLPNGHLFLIMSSRNETMSPTWNISHNFVTFMTNLQGCINFLLPPAPKFIC